MQASQECNACIFCFKCRLSQCARCACCANHTQRANDTDHTQRAKYGSDDAQHQASRSKARLSRQGRLTRFYAKDNFTISIAIFQFLRYDKSFQKCPLYFLIIFDFSERIFRASCSKTVTEYFSTYTWESQMLSLYLTTIYRLIDLFPTVDYYILMMSFLKITIKT